MLTEGACCPPPLWELFQASLLMRDQNQLTAVAEGEPRAHSSGEGHKEKLLPWLIGFQAQAAGSWDEEILVLQHRDIKQIEEAWNLENFCHLTSLFLNAFTH